MGSLTLNSHDIYQMSSCDTIYWLMSEGNDTGWWWTYCEEVAFLGSGPWCKWVVTQHQDIQRWSSDPN